MFGKVTIKIIRSQSTLPLLLDTLTEVSLLLIFPWRKASPTASALTA